MSQELRIHSYQDCWSIIYLELSRSIINELGIEGESILREVIRRYAKDRGTALKQKHQECGLKLNLYSLFNYYDLPLNTVYRQNKVKSTEEERITHTRACPIADLWKENNWSHIGRIYCEEFHHAMFGAYNSKIQVNLTQYLTQEDKDYCSFAMFLRPANMEDEERKETFTEYDQNYNVEEIDYKIRTSKDSFNVLCMKLYYYFVQVVAERGEDEEIINKGLNNIAIHLSNYLRNLSNKLDKKLNKEFVLAHLPLYLCANKDALNGEYDNNNSKLLLDQYLYKKLIDELKI